jgi:hypothetical protein
MRFQIRFLVLFLMFSSCQQPAANEATAAATAPSTVTTPPGLQDDATRRQEFAKFVAGELLDTELYEMKGQLVVAVKNPNRDDESPLAFQPVKHDASPGPHMMDGKLYADIDVLRALLDPQKKITIEGDRVYLGKPEVLVIGHHHDQTLYVPVKLFARQYGAYVDINSTIANTGNIWPKATLDYMRAHGSPQAGGLLEAWAEGLIPRIDVRAPSGG